MHPPSRDLSGTPRTTDLRLLPGGKTEPSNPELFQAYLENFAKALGVLIEQRRFQTQLNLLLSELAKWLQVRHEAVDTAYLSTHEGSLLFLLVASSEEYPDALRDELTDLEIELTNEPGLDMLSVRCMLLPRPAGPGAHSLFNSESIRYVGNEA